MRRLTVAATQMACDWDRDGNVARAEKLVRAAAARGAELILLQELFETPYFCKDQKPEHFGLAQRYEGSPLIARMSRLAAELGVVLPISFFERANNAYFNSLAMIDGDGRVLGAYRKSHIPDGPGYQEKYYFTPGDTGFRVRSRVPGFLGCRGASRRQARGRSCRRARGHRRPFARARLPARRSRVDRFAGPPAGLGPRGACRSRTGAAA